MAIPTTAMTHIQKMAPGPPNMMAAGTPMMLAAPIVDDKADVSAWRGLMSPSPFGFLKTLPNVCCNMYSGYRN